MSDLEATREREERIADELAKRIDSLAAGGHIDTHASEVLGGIVEWLGGGRIEGTE